ncbi:MAG TPA: inositol monophosphatase family protein [Trueperaceae bacterium]
MSEPLSCYLDFAIQTAYEAGRLTLGYFQTDLRTEFKSDDSPVTVADRRAEELIRARIEFRFPTHAMLGEEYGDKVAEGATHRWIIDPIDGTKAFMRGVPLYGVLLGLEIEGACAVGVAYFPALDEMLSAASGLGCHWNGRPTRVSNTESLSRGIVSCTDNGSFRRHGVSRSWEAIQDASYHRVGWSDAYGHLLVATGRIELMIEPSVKPWDCGPFPVILREAGGYFGDWQGSETIYSKRVLSTSRRLLPEVLGLVAAEGS